jgi:hypothetical protein
MKLDGYLESKKRKRSAETALTTHFGSEASSRIQGSGSGDYFLGIFD